MSRVSQQTEDAPRAYGFAMHKCLEILKKSEMPLLTQQLQVALGNEIQILRDHKFLSALKDHPRIVFDGVRKRWRYQSPFEQMVSPEAILQVLKTNPEYAERGLEITPDLLEHNPKMEEWLNTLVENKQARAIRATKAVRCKAYTAESHMKCELTEKLENKCEACATLKGIIIYSFGPPPQEELVDALDKDLKDMWSEMPLPTFDSFLETMKLQRNRSVPTITKAQRGRRRRGRGGAPTIKFNSRNKISNLHIYTTEEYKQELVDVADALL
ncbi:MAG: hypothetical protein KVP17_000138 [Porospora cf. gigantea B]|uniref:uncharacterized protein n=1 Tax=Porospora cf. gigantea B TaxID=2853592 RepID=UPI003571B4FA|nr:MAG: hypothetical protein KVP17_000138 [Porospora cf. gigantea B]